MSPRERRSHLSRRRLLSAAATGLVGGLAGCGYRPGGGDLAWASSIPTNGLLGTETTRFAVADDRLFVVQNQSGRTYDFATETWRNVENATVSAVDGTGAARLDAETERQAVASPAATEGSVIVPVEGGRTTAIDRDAAGIDPDAREATAGTASDGTGSDDDGGDDIRWQVDVVAPSGDESGESGGSDESNGSDESGETEAPREIGGLSASDRLVAAVAGTKLVALDAETGDRAFTVTEAWPDGGDGAADRVAVDGEDVWVASGGESDGGSADGESADPASTLVRFGPSGERRAERSVSAGVDWLVAVDETLVVGSAAAGTVIGFDADLDRRFAVSAPTARDRPRVVDGGDSTRRRIYLHGGGTIRALDVGDGEIAWERSDAPARRRAAVDADGIYAVRSRGILAVGADGGDRWRAPLPEGVTVDELFAVGSRLIVVDDGELYGLHATPGDRWSLLG